MADICYKQIYDELYRDKLSIPKYNKVKKYLNKIVRHYYLRIKDIIHQPEIVVFKPILDCFDLILDSDNIDNLDENINYLFCINKYGIDFGTQLYTLLFPYDAHYRFKEEYFNKFDNFFWYYEEPFKNRENPKYSNSRIEDIVKCYMKYARGLSDNHGFNELREVAYKMGAMFYLSKADLSYLDQKYDYLFSNYEEIVSTFCLNYYDGSKDFTEELAYYVLNNGMSKKKKIIK